MHEPMTWVMAILAFLALGTTIVTSVRKSDDNRREREITGLKEWIEKLENNKVDRGVCAAQHAEVTRRLDDHGKKLDRILERLPRNGSRPAGEEQG